MAYVLSSVGNAHREVGLAIHANQCIDFQSCKLACGVVPGACLHSVPKQPDCVLGRAEEWEGSACG